MSYLACLLKEIRFSGISMYTVFSVINIFRKVCRRTLLKNLNDVSKAVGFT